MNNQKWTVLAIVGISFVLIVCMVILVINLESCRISYAHKKNVKRRWIRMELVMLECPRNLNKNIKN